MILDVFTILFEADTKKAQGAVEDLGDKSEEAGEQAEKASKSIEDQASALYLLAKAAGMSSQAARAYTEAQIGATEADLEKARAAMDAADAAKRSGEEAEKSGNKFGGFAAKAIGALGAVMSVGQAISGAIGRAEDIAAIERTSNALGVAIEDVAAFGGAMERLGGDAQGARDSLTDMAESIGEALQDVESGRAKTFGALGVSLKGVDGQAVGAVEGLMRVADAVQGMSQGEAVFRIKELGITDNRTVEALLKGRKELERLMQIQKQSNPLTKEQVERAKQLTDTMGGLKGSVAGASSQFFDMMIPALTKVIEWLTVIVDWAGEHKDFVVGFFAAIAGVVSAIYLPAMIKAGIATLAATWPILAIGAAIVVAAAAFALIYDDIMNFIDGNDSFIGQMAEKYPIVAAVIAAVSEAFKKLMEWGGIAFDFLSAGASQLLEGFKLFGQGLIAVFSFIGDMWKMQFDFIMKGINMVKSGLSTVGSFFGIGGGKDGAPGADGVAVADGVAAANQQIAAASANPMNAVSSNAISNTANNNRETNVQVGQVTVQTQATDSQGISQAIGGDLSAQLKNLEAETATGVDR